MATEDEWAGASYDDFLEHTLDSMYAAYIERTKKRAIASGTSERKKEKFRMGDHADEFPEDERFGGDEDGDEEESSYEGKKRVRFDLEEDEDSSTPASMAEKKKAKQAALWFSRGIFQEVEGLDGEDNEEEDDDDEEPVRSACEVFLCGNLPNAIPENTVWW